jgi:hypothetical protein
MYSVGQNMDLCLAEETSEGVYEYVSKYRFQGFSGKIYVQKVIFELLMKHQKESKSMNRKFKIKDSLSRNVFIRSNMV